jgi:hypothetical protein
MAPDRSRQRKPHGGVHLFEPLVMALEKRLDRISDARCCCHRLVSANRAVMLSPISA